MITIQSKPPLISFAGNPMQYEIASNDKVNPGSSAELWLKIDTIDTVSGHGFTLNFNNHSLPFIVKGFPDDNGLQCWLIPNSLELYAKGIFLGLSSNYLLKSIYHLILSAPYKTYYLIQFIAKETGSRWTIDIAGNTVTAISRNNYQPGSNTIYKDNYGIICSLWTTKTVNSRSNPPSFLDDDTVQTINIGEDLKSLTSEGKATFDVSEYLLSYIKLRAEGPIRFTYPEIPFENCVEWPNHIIQYKTSFAERYNNTVRMLYYDEPRYAISGGLSREALVSYNLQDSDYFSNPENLKRFLTWAPVEKITGSTQPEKLSFLFNGSYTYPNESYRLCINVRNTDGTTSSFYGSDLQANRHPVLLECMVGYNHLGLGSRDLTRQVESWQVWLENLLGEPISEVRKFILDTDYYEHERTFLFRNSFGRYDVIRFLGLGEASLNFERTSGSTVDIEQINSFNAPYKNFEAWETQAFKANSGFVSKEVKEYFREFLLTTEAYEVVQGLLFPIVLKSAKINPFSKDGDYLYNLELEYDRAYNDQYFSGQFKPINMITSNDLTQGVGVIYEYSEELTYFGYPQNGSSSETENTWRIKQIQKTVVNGKTKHIVKWADGNLNYDNQMSNCMNLTYAYLSS